MSLLLLLGGLLTAAAGEYYLETPTLSDRAEAIELQQSMLEQGRSTRVVRRWQHGVGWGYAVVVEGLPDRETADGVAEDVAAITQRGVTVYAVEPEPGEGPPPSADAERVAPAIEDALERVIRAHGGRDGGLDRLRSAPAVRFRYDRRIQTAEGELLVRHDWWGEGESRHVSVEILDGVGQGFVSEVGPESAWLEIDGIRHDRELERARELLDALGPEAQLAAALEIPAAAASGVPFTSGGLIVIEQRDCLAVSRRLGIDQGHVELDVDLETWTVTRSVSDTAVGEVIITFQDWREVDTGLVIPFRLIVARNGLFQEEVRVIELDLSPADDRVP